MMWAAFRQAEVAKVLMLIFRLSRLFSLVGIGQLLCLAILYARPVRAVELPLREGDVVGVPWEGALGVPEKLADLMTRETGASHQQHSKVFHPLKFRDQQNLPANPGSPDVASWPGPEVGSEGAAAGINTPQSVGLNFLGATLTDTGAFPPDSMGAIGPAQYIVAVNGRIRSFDKHTGAADGVLNLDTDVFFNSVMTPPATNNFTSDPRIRYDRLSGRWFIVMIDVPGKAGVLPNRVMIAVSSGAVITTNTAWTFFQFQQDQVSPTGDIGAFADYPTLGIDANALYIGVNIFSTRGVGSFSGTTAFVVRKSSILGAGPIVVTAFRGLIPKHGGGGPYTPQGVDNYDPAATEGYVIGVDSSVYGQLDLRRILNPGGTPVMGGNVAITIPLNGPTMTVPHLGNIGGANGNLDGLDYRLLAAHFRNGRVWTSANMAVDNNGTRNTTGTRMAVRWYELSGIPTGQTPAVAQSGTIFDPSVSNSTTNRCYWMGTVMVSGQGHAAVGFSVAGASEGINAGTVGRLKNDAAGTMRTPVLYTATSTAYNPPGDPGGSAGRRWGDYSYTCLDPDDDMTMWTIQEFCSSANLYGVQVVRLLAPPPAVPTNCAPASLAAGAANANLVLSAAAGDNGFFDPGTGFSNRLAVAVNGGGVTVNSVTYNSPSNLTVNVSVASAAGIGGRTFTVTNPDGQSVTSSALLTVTPGPTNRPPILSAISNRVIHAGSLLVITNTATDPDTNALTYSLDLGGAVGAQINSTNGIFTWQSTPAVVNTTNHFTVRVTDDGTPSLSATQSFNALVVLPPSIQSVLVASNAVTLAWTSLAGQGYRIQFSSNLMTSNWINLAPDIAATNSPTTVVFPLQNSSNGFYRIRVLP
jgi:hypothetical protein